MRRWWQDNPSTQNWARDCGHPGAIRKRRPPGGTPKNGGSFQALGYYAGGYTGVHGTVHEGTVG